MKELKKDTANLTKLQENQLDINLHIGDGEGITIKHFSDLVKEVAELSFANQDNTLFFRGQAEDHKRTNSTVSSLYPSIYRERFNARNSKIVSRFAKLKKASQLLIDVTSKLNTMGFEEIRNKQYVQWSILQHYEVCDTPLLDVTHSLRVACSFALNNNYSDYGYVYVIALPYVTHRIATNSEQDTVIVRLLSICPPEALRPYYQDGYLIGTEFAKVSSDQKHELDYSRRIVGKYRIINNKDFWDQENKEIPNSILYPDNDDKFFEITKEIKEKLEKVTNFDDDLINEIGRFMLNWTNLNNLCKGNVKKSIKDLQTRKIISSIDSVRINELITIRDNIVNNTALLSADDIQSQNVILELLIEKLEIYYKNSCYI